MAGFDKFPQPPRSPFGRFRALTSSLLVGVLTLAACQAEEAREKRSVAQLNESTPKAQNTVEEHAKRFLEALESESAEFQKHEAAGVVLSLEGEKLVAYEVEIALEDSVDYKISYETSPETYLFFGARVKAEKDGKFSATVYSETAEGEKEEWGSCDPSTPGELAKCLRKMAEEHRGE